MTSKPAPAVEAEQLTVEQCLKELRNLLGLYPQIIVDIRDCGHETRSRHGRIEYLAQVGVNGQDFSGPTMANVLDQVRKWHKEQQ